MPRLDGKVDLIPGRTNSLTLETKETGLFQGQCAEFCGAQHANMLIRVVVQPPDEFEQWLEQQSQAARDDDDVQAGKQVFLSNSCVNCHRIGGTSAEGSYAPDLTHLMSRDTLASGIIPNTRENLLRWVRDPQSIKAGCLMPAFKLDEPDVERLVDYLATLR